MNVTIRVGLSLVDLKDFARISVERLGLREFLIGTRNSGRKIAIFAIRETKVQPGTESIASQVMTSLSKSIASGNKVCILTNELDQIEGDPDAEKQLESHNAKATDDEAGVEKPHGSESACESPASTGRTIRKMRHA